MIEREELAKNYPTPKIIDRPLYMPLNYVNDVEVPGAKENVMYREHGMSPFPPPIEYYELREEMQDELERAEISYKEVDIKPAIENVQRIYGLKGANIVFDNGSNAILKRIPELFYRLDSDDQFNIWGLGPHFPSIEGFSAMYNNLKYSPINRYLNSTPDAILEEAMKRISQWKNFDNLAVYRCDPNNPTGNIAGIGNRDAFLDFCAERGIPVIWDEAFGDVLKDDESAIKLTEKYPNLIVPRTLSKTTGLPGARIGYAVMSEEIYKKYVKIIEPYHLDARQRILAKHMLEPGIRSRHLDGHDGEEGVRNKIFHTKTEFMAALTREGINFLPTDPRTPILMVYSQNPEFYNCLAESDLVGTDGTGFSNTYNGNIDGRFVRFRIPKSLDEIPDMTQRIKVAIRHAEKTKGYYGA